MVRNLAKKAMTTRSQKACYVLDHLVEALGGDPSSSLRRAEILIDIAANPGTTQAEIMERLDIHKSAAFREIDWLFNQGCIRRSNCSNDARAVRLEIWGYSKTALENALEYFAGDYDDVKAFISGFAPILKQQKPTLRDAKIFSTVFEKGEVEKREIMQSLYNGPASTDARALSKLLEDGVLEDHGH